MTLDAIASWFGTNWAVLVVGWAIGALWNVFYRTKVDKPVLITLEQVRGVVAAEVNRLTEDRKAEHAGALETQKTVLGLSADGVKEHRRVLAEAYSLFKKARDGANGVGLLRDSEVLPPATRLRQYLDEHRISILSPNADLILASASAFEHEVGRAVVFNGIGVKMLEKRRELDAIGVDSPITAGDFTSEPILWMFQVPASAEHEDIAGMRMHSITRADHWAMFLDSELQRAIGFPLKPWVPAPWERGSEQSDAAASQ